MTRDYMWTVRCSETGDFVGECGCFYCFDEFDFDMIEESTDVDDSEWDEEDDYELSVD